MLKSLVIMVTILVTIERYSLVDKVSLPKNPQDHAQNDMGNDSDDGNDTLHTLQGKDYQILQK